MRHWELWSLRWSALAYWLVVWAVALAVCVLAVAASGRPEPGELHRFGAIALTAALVIVCTRLVGRIRGERERSPWAIHCCYLLAGLLTLPLNLVVLLLLGPALHGVLGVRPAPHRWAFTTAATVVATFLARAFVGWHDVTVSPNDIVLAGVVLVLTRALLVGVGFWLRDPAAGVVPVAGDPIDIVLGVVAVCLGGLMGLVAISHGAAYALLVGPPMALLDQVGRLPHWRRSAQHDAKTGLANAVHWDRVARDELARARPRRTPVALLLLDIDHFKRVNDQVGHLAGDAALAAVALLLRGSVRRGDVVGRFGGEEFVVLLQDAGSQEARAVAEALRVAVAELRVPVPCADGEWRDLDGITISIGVATSERFGYDLSSLLTAADAALLSAKGAGRNLVTMA
ncbi:diguanylate cyclase [Actinoalloteichus spitiensis]|uniref:diguanylate cyclase n=1 Tax=Actinoalloteichus spitiensis TaxID=252394 RepID=UPI00035EF0B6|nr:diguanylate cyclase [Actinoalloteichus spitiensis]